MDGQLQCRIHVDDPLGQCSKSFDFRWLFLTPRRSNVQLAGRRAGEAEPFHDLGDSFRNVRFPSEAGGGGDEMNEMLGRNDQ